MTNARNLDIRRTRAIRTAKAQLFDLSMAFQAEMLDRVKTRQFRPIPLVKYVSRGKQLRDRIARIQQMKEPA